MAKNDDITTRFKADIKDFKAGIEEAKKEITLANSKFKAASDGTKEWEKSTDGLSSKVTQLKSILDSQNKKLDAYKEELKVASKYEEEAKEKVEKLKKALSEAERVYGKNSKEVGKLKSELTQAEKEENKMSNQVHSLTVSMNNQQGTVNRTTAQLDRYTKELQETKKAQTSSGEASTIFNKSVSAMGEKLKGFAGNVVQYAIDKLKELGEETIENGKKFTSAMSKVKAISSSNSKEFKKLSNKALEMGKKTKFSATESAEAFTYMSMAGWKTNDMLDGIEGIMNLAAASGEDLATTSDIVTDSLTAFGLKAKDTNRFVDVLAQASRNSNTNVSLMGESFKYVAPVAGQFRYRVEDVALGLGIMANSGIKATNAGTSMRAIFTRLATNAGATKNSIGALDVVTKKLGVRFYDEQGKIRPFGDFLTDLRKKWKGLSDSEKINFAKKIAGMNALSGFNTLVEASDEDFKKLKKSIDGSSGAAKEMADVMEDNLEGDFHKLNSSIESVEQKIYKKLEPALRKGTQKLKEFVDDFNNGINETESPKDFLKARGKGIYDFLFDDTTIKDLKRFGSDVKKSFSDINTVIDKVREELYKPTFFDDTTIKDLKRFGSDVGKTFESLYNKVKGVDWKGTWEGIKNSVGGFGERIGKSFSEAKNTVSNFFDNVKNKAVDSGKKIGGSISNFFDNAKNKAVDSGKKIGGSISNVLSKVGIKTKESGDFISTEIEKNANTSLRTIDTNGKTAFSKLKNYVTSARNSISNNSNSAKNSVKNASASASSSFEKSSKSIKASWKNATNSIKNTNLKDSTKKSGKSAIDGIIEGIESKASSLWSKVKEVSRGLVGLFEKKLKINSPSKVMRDRIGKNIARGIAVGITKETKTVLKSINVLTRSYLTTSKTSLKNSGFEAYSKRLINVFNTRIDNYVKSSTTSFKNLISNKTGALKKATKSYEDSLKKSEKKQKKSNKKSSSKSNKSTINSINDNLKNTKEATKKITTAYTNTLKNFQAKAKKIVNDTLTNITKTYEEKYNKLVELHDTTYNKMLDFGNLTTNLNGVDVITSTESIKEQTKYIKEYGDLLKKIKGKVGQNLYSAIANMDIKVGKSFAENMLKMNSKDLKEYNKAYEDQIKTAKATSDSIYKNDFAKLNKEYNTAIDKGLKNANKKLEKLGADSIKGFVSGMKIQTKNLSKDVKGIANNIVKQFKKYLKIKSPSRVFADQVGKMIPLGISKGISDNVNSIYSDIKALSNGIVGYSNGLVSNLGNTGINNGYENNSNNVNITLNQTNNSPKALSRWDIYKDTKRQLSLMKEVMSSA